MKRSLAILTIFSVLALGFVGALAALPHSHGGDFSHAKHSTCPVYQLGLHGHDISAGAWSGLLFTLAFLFFVSLGEFFVFFRNSHFSVLLRAPPASL